MEAENENPISSIDNKSLLQENLDILKKDGSHDAPNEIISQRGKSFDVTDVEENLNNIHFLKDEITPLAENLCDEITDDGKEPDLIQENPTETKHPKTFVMDGDDSHLTQEDGWLDIFGTGDFKKRVIKPGDGRRVQAKNSVTVNYTMYKDGSDEVLERVENFEFIVGDLDVVKGIDLAVPIMEYGETAEILVPSRLAFGKIGRPPDVPPDCNLLYEVEILKVEELDEENLAPSLAMKYGNQKRDRGNFWYGQSDYISAVHCYKRAAEFLDSIQDGSDCDPELLQEILDTKIKVYNNMAASHMKMDSYDQALKAVDFVLKIQSKNVKALFRKAKILSEKGLTDEAVVYLRKAAELEPETKVIQQELQRLLRKRQVEVKTQKEMYKRMFTQSSSSKSKPSRLKMAKYWTIMAGGCAAVAAISVAAYRQYFS